MKRTFTNLLALAALLLLPALASAQSDSCAMTINGHDSYGDGWNGGTVTVYQNGVQIASFTIASGSEGSLSFNVGSDSPVQFVYTAGSYSSENTFTVSNGFGELVYSSPTGNQMTSGDTCYVASVPCPSCAAPTALVVSDITNNGATLSWTPAGEESSWIVRVNGEAIADSPVSEPTVTLSDYDANTLYNVEILTPCDDGNTSSALSGSFKTLCQNGNCDLKFQTSGYYAGSVNVYQNSNLISTVTGATSVEICNGDSVVIIYQAPSYSYGTSTWSVIDAGESVIATFDNSHATGDTVMAVASGCPTCMPVTNMRVSDADEDFFTVSWDGPDNAVSYILYIDSVEVTDYDGTSTEYTMADLTNSDRHLVQVRVDCGDEDSSAWRQIYASATCSITHISADDEAEFYETFAGIDGTLGGTVSASGDKTASHALMPCWYFSGNNVWPKNEELMFENAQDYVCLPIMDAPINTLEITWWGKIGNVGDSPDSVILGVADISGQNVEWLDTIFYVNQSRATGAQHPWYRYEDYAGEGVRFAFKVLYGNVWNSFKNFHVRQIPQCFAPTDLTGHNYIDVDSTYFTWVPQGSAETWQVALGTPEDDPSSLTYVDVTENSYLIPTGTLTMGEQYTIWVRSDCGDVQSEWKGHTFYAGTVIMPTSGSDTVSGCGLTIYDCNYQDGYPGGGISNTLVVRPANEGEIVGIASGWFRNYTYESTHLGSLTIYDGEGTNGTVLYTTDVYSTITDTILGEEGPITIQMNGGSYGGDGFELFTFCTAAPTCIRPKHLAMSDVQSTTATLNWNSSNATNYTIYYKPSNDSVWQEVVATDVDSTYTFEEGTFNANTNYDIYLIGNCDGEDNSQPSATITFRTACAGDTCQLTIDCNYDYTLIQNGNPFPAVEYSYYGTTVDVCSGEELYLYSSATYGTITITNVAGIELYNGQLSDLADTVNLGQPCPSCMPATDLQVSDITANGATFTWTPMDATNVIEWVVYVDDVEYMTVSDGSNSAAITGLTANTIHTLAVSASCGEEDSSIVRSTTFRTMCEGGSCVFNVEMADSYGDGWNGSSINVFQSGTTFETLTIATGNNNTVTVSPCLGEPVTLVWHAGSYTSEASFTIKNADDSVLMSFSNCSNLSEGDTLVVFDGSCNATVYDIHEPIIPGSCDDPTALTATATETTIDFSFSGTATDYDVEILEGSYTVYTWPGFTENAVRITTTSYTFEGLEPGTEYTIGVRAVCDEEEFEYSNVAVVTVSTEEHIVENCDAPVDVDVPEATTDSTYAIVHWTEAGSATMWQISLKRGSDEQLFTTSNNPYTVSGLTPGATYYVKVRALCSATDTSAWSQSAAFQTPHGGTNPGGDTTGIAAVDELAVSLYPNPASDYATLEVAEPAEVTLVDLNGRTVYAARTEGTLRIELSQLSRGTYFVRIVSESGLALRKLVVK